MDWLDRIIAAFIGAAVFAALGFAACVWWFEVEDPVPVLLFGAVLGAGVGLLLGRTLYRAIRDLLELLNLFV